MAAGQEESRPLFIEGLRRAIDAGEIEILFQPQAETATGRIAGAEALVRWRQPDLGEIGAQTLFAMAGRAGMQAELSRYIQRKAIVMAAAWPETLGHLVLSVNLTAQDVASADCADHLMGLAREHGVDFRRLAVEVTETELIRNLDTAAASLQKLREVGIRVALDDFGTGYSSLLYLKSLPLDGIKLDKLLTHDIAGSDRDRIVIKGIIRLARELGLDVLAEGVETREQLRLLREEGCLFYQGFLCSPPVALDQLIALVER